MRTTEGLTSVPEQPATVPFSFRIATPATAGVAILNENGTVAGCSGTLVSPSVVLTAAHCVASDPVGILTVFFPGGARANYFAKAFAIHPEYSPSQLADADLALLLLESPVADVAPMPLATKRSEEHTSELQSPCNLVCRLLLEK